MRPIRVINLLLAVSAIHHLAVAQTPPVVVAKPTVKVDVAKQSDLVRAEKFIEAEQWDEGIELLRRVQQEDGAKLIELTQSGEGQGGNPRFTTLNTVCQMRLSRLRWSAPEALDLYRRRVDPLARRWFEQGVEDRNEQLLARIVDQLFASSYGDDALMQLGELALERGQFDSAREYWERISPLLRTPSGAGLSHIPPAISWWRALRGINLDDRWNEMEPLMTEISEAPGWLCYPDSNLRIADVRARLVLVSILEGSRTRAAWEWEVFGRLQGEAEGHLAGRQGELSKILSEILTESKDWPGVGSELDWPTFAGSQSRNRSAHGNVDIAGRPLWEIDLPRQDAEGELIGFGRQRIAEDIEAGMVSFHPVVVGDVPDGPLVLWNESHHIKAARLRSHPAQPPWRDLAVKDEKETFAILEVSEPEKVLHDQRIRQYVGVPRYTMIVHGHKLFARMGSPLTSSREESEEDRLVQPRSLLMGLDLSKQGKVLPGFPIQPDGARWEFEGTPVCDGRHLFVAMRFGGGGSGRAELHVACFELRTVQPAKKLRPKWRVKICDGSTLNAVLRDVDEITHNLLSLHEGIIYCNTNLGAVAAVRATDGLIRWITQYPRAPFRPVDPDVSDLHYFRDLNPCVLHQGIVMVAPQDTPQILAFDVLTGEVVWKAKAADAVHLLGVADNHLIASGDSLYWIDVFNGAVRCQFPFPGHVPRPDLARPEPRGYGRGVLSGGLVYFPTRDQIFVFEQELLKPQKKQDQRVQEPRAVRVIDLQRRGVTGGNLVIADGRMLIAGPNKLYAFDEFGPRPQPVKK